MLVRCALRGEPECHRHQLSKVGGRYFFCDRSSRPSTRRRLTWVSCMPLAVPLGAQQPSKTGGTRTGWKTCASVLRRSPARARDVLADHHVHRPTVRRPPNRIGDPTGVAGPNGGREESPQRVAGRNQPDTRAVGLFLIFGGSPRVSCGVPRCLRLQMRCGAMLRQCDFGR